MFPKVTAVSCGEARHGEGTKRKTGLKQFAVRRSNFEGASLQELSHGSQFASLNQFANRLKGSKGCESESLIARSEKIFGQANEISEKKIWPKNATRNLSDM